MENKLFNSLFKGFNFSNKQREIINDYINKCIEFGNESFKEDIIEIITAISDNINATDDRLRNIIDSANLLTKHLTTDFDTKINTLFGITCQEVLQDIRNGVIYFYNGTTLNISSKQTNTIQIALIYRGSLIYHNINYVNKTDELMSKPLDEILDPNIPWEVD